MIDILRTRKAIVVVACALAAAALPGLAAGGAVHGTESWSDEPTSWFGPDECSDGFVTGLGVESGTATFVDSPNGGNHVRIEAHGTVDLYVANGPGPWDPQPGAFVGTWTYDVHVSDQGQGGKGAVSGIAEGSIALADGSTARRQVSFHLTLDEPSPPKVFFAKFICPGG